MNPRTRSSMIRSLVAAALLAGLAVLAGKSILPDVPMVKLVLYAFVGAAATFAVVLAASVASLQFRQFILRKGGTDPQWFWFSSEPAGLVKLREEERAEVAARQAERTR